MNKHVCDRARKWDTTVTAHGMWHKQCSIHMQSAAAYCMKAAGGRWCEKWKKGTSETSTLSHGRNQVKSNEVQKQRFEKEHKTQNTELLLLVLLLETFPTQTKYVHNYFVSLLKFLPGSNKRRFIYFKGSVKKESCSHSLLVNSCLDIGPNNPTELKAGQLGESCHILFWSWMFKTSVFALVSGSSPVAVRSGKRWISAGLVLIVKAWHILSNWNFPWHRG